MGRRTYGNGSRGGRAGFTLVELLVVIIIIAILAALAVPAVMRATATAQNARIKTEIDMLHQAIMQYKNEYGSFPPCLDETMTATTVSGKHLARLFPRCSTIPAQLASPFYFGNGNPPALPNQMIPATPLDGTITPRNALFYWLSGFTDDPTSPIAPTNARKKLFDFDMSRWNQTTGALTAPGKPSSPYIYISSNLYTITSGNTTILPEVAYPNGDGTSGKYFAHRVPTKLAPNAFNDLAQPAFNPDTFQILSAGRDEKFGTDDDMSNFWPGTRKDYLDSLK